MGGLLSMEGRYNRAKYFWTVFLLGFAIIALCIVLGFAVGKNGGDPAVAAGLSLFISIPGTVIIAFQEVKRFHDLDRPGSHFWLTLIPIYNIYLHLILAFKKGTIGPNRFGPDPLSGR